MAPALETTRPCRNTPGVIKITHPRNVATLLRSLDEFVIVAPAAALSARSKALRGLPEHVRAAALDLADEIGRSTTTGLATTRLEDGPERLYVLVLPDGVSRHNCPARAEAIRSGLLPLGRHTGRLGFLSIVDSPQHALASHNAVSRAFPGVDLKSDAGPTPKLALLAMTRDGEPVQADTRLKETVTATRLAAELVDHPPTDMNPAALAKRARQALQGLAGVTIREIRGDKLLAEGLGGIHAVGRTAVEAPRMLIARYEPTTRKADQGHVALVGKGVTYDTGGLHLKPRGGMEGMKCDMGGAAAVLGAFRALVASKSRRRMSLLLCLAENAIGPGAYKPDDVLTLHSGLTVEINNTDAEGRLLLGDGVSYASRKLGADLIIDAATLTGAQLIATGLNHAAVVTNDEDLERQAVDAGRRSGDLVHPLPFAPEFHRPEFRSPIADMRNSVKNRSNAQSSCAAAFVHWHLPQNNEPRWCHIDLAGPAVREDRGTGFGVALIAELVEPRA